MKIVLILISAPVFMMAAVVHIIIKVRLNTKNNPDIDDYYYEFEEQEPKLAAYKKYTSITFTIMIVAALLLFLAIML